MTRRTCISLLLLAAYTLTHAAEKVLYEKASEYNHIIVTEDENGIRSLLFEKNGALQSVVKLNDPSYLALPYARAMCVGLTFMKDPPERVLILGLGGGTLPRFLHAHYPDMHIDAVDIDPAVAEVARKYFAFREDARMKVHIADGRDFIARVTQPYDVIMLDAYGYDSLPYHLATVEFLALVRKALTPGGVVIGNVWSRASNPLYAAMARTYQAAFDEFYLFDVRASGNKVFIGLPRKETLPSAVLETRAREIVARRALPFDLADIVRWGYRHATAEQFSRRILTDANKPGVR